MLQVRHVDRFVQRPRERWPIGPHPVDQFYLDPSSSSLSQEPAKASGIAPTDGSGKA